MILNIIRHTCKLQINKLIAAEANRAVKAKLGLKEIAPDQIFDYLRIYGERRSWSSLPYEDFYLDGEHMFRIHLPNFKILPNRFLANTRVERFYEE